MTFRIARLASPDTDPARRLFRLMAEVFGEECGALGDAFVGRLLADPAFWAIAALSGDEIVGGLTAHTLPMTRSESFAIFIYDIAVRVDHQRLGVGRALVGALRTEAADRRIDDLFVLADDKDTHALDFYRALGGVASPVTMFALP